MAFQIRQLEKNDLVRALDIAHVRPDELYALAGMGRPSRTYYVRWKGKLHSLKAVITLAALQHDPSARSTDFNSGTEGAPLMRALGFDVEHNPARTAERTRVSVKVLSRPQQALFHSNAVDAYTGRCPISGCSTIAALEASHVIPVADLGDDKVGNSILLRVDLHRLFDLDLLAIDPTTGRVSIHASCQQDYASFAGVVVSLPKTGPRLHQFADRWRDYQRLATL